MVLSQRGPGIRVGLLVEQANKRLVAEGAVAQGDAAGPIHLFAGMLGGEIGLRDEIRPEQVCQRGRIVVDAVVWTAGWG